jgi:hypothetical protein
LTLTEELLGTASNDPNIHREYIASNAPDAPKLEEEVAAVGSDAVAEKSMTVFPREDGKPFLWDYQIKGFFKDACGMLSRVPGTASKEIKAWRKVIDGLVFVTPRKIMVTLPNGATIGNCQRPLRAQTAQGERIALAESETVPAGTRLAFEVTTLDPKLEKLVREWFEYGRLRGLGQWRNSGKGRFEWEEVK